MANDTFKSVLLYVGKSIEETSKELSAFAGTASKLCTKLFKKGSELLNTFICVLDELPFVFFNSLGKIGPYLLVGAGYIVFLKEMYEGIAELSEALEKKGEGRNSLIAIHASKILFSYAGFISTSLVLAFCLSGMALGTGIAAIGVPAMVTMIAATELAEKVHGYIYAKKEWEVANKSGDVDKINKAIVKVDKARRKVAFASIFVGTGVIITTFAVVSVLSGLGVLSLGIIPSAVLMAVASAAFLIKLFQLIDKEMDFKMTKAIEGWFTPKVEANSLLKDQKNTLTNTNTVINGVIGNPVPLTTTVPSTTQEVISQPRPLPTVQPGTGKGKLKDNEEEELSSYVKLDEHKSNSDAPVTLDSSTSYSSTSPSNTFGS